MRDTFRRWEAVISLTQFSVGKIAEVQGKDWPEFLIVETIDRLLAARKLAADEILSTTVPDTHK
jgi:hypothetical protein